MDDYGRLLRIEYGEQRIAVESVLTRERFRRNEQGSPDSYTRQWICSGALRDAKASEVARQRDALRAAIYRDDQNVRVIALDNTVTEWVSAEVVRAENGSGPSCVDLDLDDVTQFECRFRFTLEARRAWPGGLNLPTLPRVEQEVIEVVRAIDGQQAVTRTGKVQGENASQFLQTLIPAATPLTQVRVRTRRNEGDSQIDYAIELLPLVKGLPPGVRDGELTVEESSEALYTTRVARGHYVGDGAADAARLVKEGKLGLGRNVEPDRSSSVETTHREKRLDFSFEARRATRKDGVIEWTEALRVPYRAISATAIQYPGTAPLFIVDPFPPLAIEHAGQITALDQWPTPRTPVFDEAMMSEPGDVRYERDAGRTRRVSYRYAGLTLAAFSPQEVQEMREKLTGPNEQNHPQLP